MTVGDVTSDARGTGARFNAGKPDLALVPLRFIADQYNATELEAQAFAALQVLYCLARWQERKPGNHLGDAMRWLGRQVWAECAHVFDYGRRKYAAWNWAKGMPWSVPLACAARHLLAILDGEHDDPESKHPHRGHVLCNMVMLATFEHTFAEGDDRAPAGRLG
jgi:hypothetical protein